MADQPLLLDVEPNSRWRVVPYGGPGKGGSYFHLSGWSVHHCGHSTALYPYTAIDPLHPGSTVVAPSGRGFRRLAEAQAWVELASSGRAHSVADGDRSFVGRPIRRLARLPSH